MFFFIFFAGNWFRHRYRFPRDIGSSVDTEYHRESVLKLDTVFQEISSGVDTNIPGNWFHCEYRFPGNQFQRGCRYSKEIVFNVNTDIPRKSAPTWIPFPRKSVLEWIPIFQVFFGFSLNRFSGSLCLLGQ
ncbi:uncharacterized protein OCT59_002928 [Rhizophagus irregularis]|uniref:uncharacterized protein n=1 Tax=Rhizophagus irregularis TaxID=588596 RepID=UPI00332C6169|nr:hypothetical protein OCT59_002928 [Rhizophagus irregularis]